TPDHENAIRWIYEPGSFTPLARYEKGQLLYAITDTVGRIQELLTEDGTLVWRGKQQLWGREEGRQKDGAPTCRLRFPGQYDDDESGLFYNRFRYYDCDTGQYLSADPVGLLGGVNPYGYVANPLRWIDPLGLCKKDAPKPFKASLNSIETIFKDPMVLKGHTPESLLGELGSVPIGWISGEMRKSRSAGGFTLRELNTRSTDVTDRYIQYHPGSSRHYNGAPYWKVSSGSKGTVRFPVEGN
ncbi:RHS repeat-associated core domain-containing protein, partial [Yokenella regensburgei]|uniref:RHS repeat-associated core domain-containing protein n=2 Tax=Yokenella regensburgei TaxID=158877 RepID=UPI003F5CBDE4